MLLYNLLFCRVKAKSELNISMICGGGADAEQNFLESEWTRSQKIGLCPSLVFMRSSSTQRSYRDPTLDQVYSTTDVTNSELYVA